MYEEQASGKNIGRPQLEGCLKSLREGDTLVVWRLDRLGRNLADLVGLIAELEQRKINFESLTEKIETGSPAGRLVFHVFAALAEFERNLIRERTVAGLKAARARGRTGGRPSKLSAKEIKTIRALLKSADIPVSEIAARFHIARSTLYRVLKPAA
jgi:DNA invertase Pin-like site-specific DNA recombinase